MQHLEGSAVLSAWVCIGWETRPRLSHCNPCKDRPEFVEPIDEVEAVILKVLLVRKYAHCSTIPWDPSGIPLIPTRRDIGGQEAKEKIGITRNEKNGGQEWIREPTDIQW